MRIAVASAAIAALAACEKPRPTDPPTDPVVTDSKRAPPGQAGGEVTIRTVPVAGGLHMLIGQGGNIGVLVGDDGVLMIDDQFDRLAPKIKAAIAALSDEPVGFVINTHHHGDHTGGNPIFAAGATIVAHRNVRTHLIDDGKPKAGWPVITYDSDVTFHLNGVTIRAVHFPRGHTDGDSIVFFDELDAVHAGDHFFRNRFPFIDLDAGGDPVQLLANVDRLLDQLKPGTKIIPGHGDLATVEDLRTYRTMLAESIEHVNELLAQGKSLTEAKKIGPPAKWASWGTGFVTGDRWIETLYRALGSSN
jgi:glyoxylase-like metal-dependent hydrolase (beta-lactamase superfamily II)